MTRHIVRNAIIAAALTVSTAGFAMTSTPDYLAKAGAGDLYETQSSKLVMATTKNAAVRGFARQMVADHMKSTAMVKTAAMKSSVKASPPMLDADQKAMIAALKAAKGEMRDKLYLEQQHMAHMAALALHKDYAATGDKPALKMAASEIVPVVEKHIASMDAVHVM